MTKVYSNDGESYPYDSLGELIDHRDEAPNPGDEYWVATKVSKTASEYWSLPRMLDQMRDDAAEEAGEWSEGFAELAHDNEGPLQKRIAGILDEMIPVDFYTVANPVRMAFEAEDCVSVCTDCSGSGEGQSEGSRCTTCKGKGEI
jgi:hypothetical protein